MTLKQFISVSRPYSWPASLAPIAVAIALAGLQGDSNWLVATLCLVVGLSAQSFSNCCNDYYDFKRGADGAGRVGFSRPLASGQLRERDIIGVALFWGLITAVAGVTLCLLTNPWLLLLGALIILFAWMYTGGPFPLAYLGLGDVAVMTFYGWVAVMTTYYLLTGSVTTQSFLVATAMGAVAVNILVVNNYRDYEEDLKNQKRTSIVRLGREFAPKFYLANILLAWLLSIVAFKGNIWGIVLLLPYLLYALSIYRQMIHMTGSQLNAVLRRTSMGVVLLAVVHIAAYLIDGLLL